MSGLLFDTQDIGGIAFFEEELTMADRLDAASIASELLKQPGWSGPDLDQLERAAGLRDDDPELLRYITDMRDQREREQNDR